MVIRIKGGIIDQIEDTETKRLKLLKISSPTEKAILTIELPEALSNAFKPQDIIDVKIDSKPIHTQDMQVRNGQTWIYAEPSGDFNPIHTDDKSAMESGLGGIVLQGLCTMAFAHKVCVDKLGGELRDPMKIRKLAVQFARSVKPGDTVTFQLFKQDEEKNGIRYTIKAINQRKKNLLYDAWCLVV